MFVIIMDANPLLLYLVKISNPIQTSTSVGIRCKRASKFCEFCITRIADFHQFLPVLAQISYRGAFSLFGAFTSHVQGSISNARGTFEPQIPIIWPETFPGGLKFFFLPFLSKGRLNLWAKYSKPINKIKHF